MSVEWDDMFGGCNVERMEFKNMKKILIIANSCMGLMSFRKELVSALVARNYEVTVCAPEDSRADDVRSLGASVVPVEHLSRRGTNPLKDLALMRFLRGIIRTENPDVVLTYTIKPNIYGGMSCARLGVPYIVNITGLGTAVENPGLLQRLTVRMYRRAMRRANRIFFQNSANRDFFVSKGIAPDVHALIPGSGVNLSHHVAQEYPCEDKPVRFLFISRLMKQKGIEEYFACAERFKGRAEFHILGVCEEDYTDRLKELSDAGIVVYHGKQLDVRPFIADAHCLIHPTYYPEGMSNVVLESAAAARPVITTNRPGCREAVDDGVTGFLFPERDREALFKAVERFLAMPYQAKRAMGLAGRKKMEQQFSREIVVDAYLSEIEKI